MRERQWLLVSYSQGAWLGLGGMVSVSELSSKRRKVEEAKDTDRLQPKREAVGYSSPFWEYTNRVLPV